MVASSVVSTILILNYHHRSADTHEMSDWVSENSFIFTSTWIALHCIANRLHIIFYNVKQVRLVFLYWLPLILRMNRPPGRGPQMPMDYPPTPCSNNSEQPNKSHHHLPQNNHLNILTDVELKQRCSKSLLANVLDINDDFRHNNCRPLLPGGGVGSSSTLPPNSSYFRTVFRWVER